MSPDKALQTLRILWAAITGGLVMTAAVVVALVKDTPDPGTVSLGPVRVGTLALAGLMVLMGVGYFVRLQVYKKGWRQNAVTPASYVQGNVVLFALLEGAGIGSLILGGYVGDRFACFGIATAALAGLILNFPTGGPMRPAEPRL